MKGRWLWIVIGANLVVLVALAFVVPHLMLAPGALEKHHADLTTDCFACHAPLRGAAADRCMACHKLPDIGLRTTKGAAITEANAANTAKVAKVARASFHQALGDPNCMACHTDHAGPKLVMRSSKPFSHTMLRATTRDQCATCHAAPTNELHRTLGVGCATCHNTQAWKPATFDHARYFVLDNNHNATCVTCHIGNNYQQYTCYGCHEHTPANIQAKHREEVGSQNLDNCVRCHRSGSGEREGRGEGERGKGRGERD